MEKRGWEMDDRENPWGYVSYWVPYNAVRIMGVGLGRVKREMSEKQRQALQAHSFSSSREL